MLEFVNLRVSAIGKNPELTLPKYPTDSTPLTQALKEKRTVWLESGPTEIQIYDREKLGVGTSVPGPCLVEEDINTILVPTGDTGFVDEYKSFISNVPYDLHELAYVISIKSEREKGAGIAFNPFQWNLIQNGDRLPD